MERVGRRGGATAPLCWKTQNRVEKRGGCFCVDRLDKGVFFGIVVRGGSHAEVEVCRTAVCVFMVILGPLISDVECRVFVTAHPLAAMCLVGFMMAVCRLTIWLTSENPFGPPSNEPIHRYLRSRLLRDHRGTPSLGGGAMPLSDRQCPNPECRKTTCQYGNFCKHCGAEMPPPIRRKSVGDARYQLHSVPTIEEGVRGHLSFYCRLLLQWQFRDQCGKQLTERQRVPALGLRDFIFRDFEVLCKY